MALCSIEVLVSDITTRKQKEFDLHQRATIDGLTQIPNRTLGLDRLEQTLKRALRFNHSFAVFFLDLDGFKQINDIYGHQVGDQILQQTADRIQNQIRESDTLARLGGDEFLLILNSLEKPENAEKLAQSIIRAVNRPFNFDNIQHTIGVSLGIFIYDQFPLKAMEVIQRADAAMYQAKNLGGNTYVLAHPASHKHVSCIHTKHQQTIYREQSKPG